MLEISGLWFRYGRTAVLKDISFQLRPGEILSIVGPNGVGKTTLLRCLLGILKSSQGEVFIERAPARRMSPKERARHLAYVPQNEPLHLPVKVLDVVLMGRRPQIGWIPSNRDLEIVERIISRMGLEQIVLRDFDRLSGGQRQKVMLARAFAQESRYLLLDEPTSNLDLKHQLEVMELLVQMAKQKCLGVLLAIHDLNLAARFSDRMMMLRGGDVFCLGEPVNVLREETIREVYGVEVCVSRDNGHWHILPLSVA